MKIKLLILPLCLLLLASCDFWRHQPDEVQYPLLDAGIRMANFQMAVQQEYVEMYDFVSPEQQQFMREEIAPLINAAKHSIIAYNNAVLDEEEPPVPEIEIWRFLRGASTKLSRMRIE